MGLGGIVTGSLFGFSTKFGSNLLQKVPVMRGWSFFYACKRQYSDKLLFCIRIVGICAAYWRRRLRWKLSRKKILSRCGRSRRNTSLSREKVANR